jgi:hypothetical protein
MKIEATVSLFRKVDSADLHVELSMRTPDFRNERTNERS